MAQKDCAMFLQTFKAETSVEHVVIVYQREHIPEEAICVHFNLIYQGQLLAATSGQSRSAEKHQIRQALHGQLKQLWQVHPILSKMKTANTASGPAPYKSFLDATADNNDRFGYRFVPVVFSSMSLSCALDLTLLRRDEPGSLVSAGGDIDNRLKTLFDALRMPRNREEMEGRAPSPDENPFYVLLEDDSQITKVSVSADRLLLPIEEGQHMNDVHLIIRVDVNVVAPF
jgi:hypothetical protein